MIKKILLSLIFIASLASCQSNISEPAPQAPQISQQTLPEAGLNVIPQTTQNQPLEPAQIIRKKVKIAALLPLSGKNKELGNAMLNSIILSLFENDQQNIELAMFDSSNLRKAANDIIAQNIKIVIGPIFSTDVEHFHYMMKDQNVTIISFSNNQDLANKKGVFLMGFLPEQQIERITGYAVLQGKEDFALIAPSNQYGKKFAEILDQMVKRKDGNLVASELYANSSKDLEKAVFKAVNSYIIAPSAAGVSRKKLKDEDKFYANVILIPESGATLTKIVKLIKSYNTSEREIQIVGSSNWDDISTLNNPDLIGGWFTSSDPVRYKEFERTYYQTYNKIPPRISSIAYDAALAAIEVIRKSENKEITPEDFVNYKSVKNGFIGVDGLFRFLPNGLVQRNFAVLEIENGKFQVIDGASSMFFKY